MEILLPHTPAAIGIITLLSVLVLLRLIIDIKEIITAHHMKQAVGRYIARQYQPTMSVLIDLRRRADTILPLLDNLAAHRHKQLDILVIIKHTAGKNARPTLEQYKDTHPAVHLRILSHQKGTSMIQYAHDMTSADIVMQLSDEQRLSKHFFALAARPFIDHRVSIIRPRDHIIAGRSLASACHVIVTTWQHFFRLIYTSARPLTVLEPGLLYRRTDLLAPQSSTPLYRPQLAIQTTAVTSWRDLVNVSAPRRTAARIAYITVSIMTLGLLTITGLWALYGEQSGFAFSFLVGCYVVHYSLVQLSLRGYSLRDQVSIVLFAPFSLLALPLAALWPHRNIRL